MYEDNNNYWDQPKEAKEEKADKKPGLASKILVSLSMGLLFGIFAGVGFLGVTQTGNLFMPESKPTVLEQPVSGAIEDAGIPELPTTAVLDENNSMQYVPAGNNVSGIVKNVMPAMVSIINNYTDEIQSFWGQTYREDRSASGSGIIVAQNDKELLIVSNEHVVAGANQLLVTLNDGTEVEAVIKGTDAEMDLAVIAIRVEDLSKETMSNLVVASLGNSDDLELGDQVIAIGNALGYGQSVTVGYVSALDRELELEDGTTRKFIQTDAAINHGNSGGALLNAVGEVIGINSAKIDGSSVEGMGYAIPITAASPIIADLMERQTRYKVDSDKMGYMGISYQDVTDQIAQLYGMPKGVYIVSVQEGSGAEAAGIVKGDVITKFDGNRITSFADLQNTLQYLAVGDTAKLTVMRPENGEYVAKELEITLGERPTESR